MMLTQLIIIGLSTFSLTYMMRYVDGPFDIFRHIRVHGGLQYTEVNIDDVVTNYEIVPDRFMPKLLSCFWCLGTWVALIMMIIYQFVPVVVEWMAVLAVANIIHMILDKD